MTDPQGAGLVHRTGQRCRAATCDRTGHHRIAATPGWLHQQCGARARWPRGALALRRSGSTGDHPPQEHRGGAVKFANPQGKCAAALRADPAGRGMPQKLIRYVDRDTGTSRALSRTGGRPRRPGASHPCMGRARGTPASPSPSAVKPADRCGCQPAVSLSRRGRWGRHAQILPAGAIERLRSRPSAVLGDRQV